MSFYRNFFKVVEEISERNTFEIVEETQVAAEINFVVAVFSKPQKITFFTTVQELFFYKNPASLSFWQQSCFAHAPPLKA